jgi:hypothetical protein
MRTDRAVALGYLRARVDGPWRWVDSGSVVAWSDGTTVAFREEIRQVLEWLAPGGLPPFGAVVVLLAACRGRVPKLEDLHLDLPVDPGQLPLPLVPPVLGQEPAPDAVAERGVRSQALLALDQLLRVARLPGEVNAGLKARCVLAEAVFEAAEGDRSTEASRVLSGLSMPMSDADLRSPSKPGGRTALLREVEMVARGLRAYTAEGLSLRLRTGLDGLPVPAEPEVLRELPMSERARQWLETLGDDSELGAVARGAKDLMAALRLPRRLTAPEDGASEGVADLSQRGSLDRLLVSELAHDDLTLAVRVALNEALYLQREPPAREPPGGLEVFLDTGVRLWGIPRLLAASVGLALMANSGRQQGVRVWRARGGDIVPAELLTREGLTEHLGCLEPSVHPGPVLAGLADRAEEVPGGQCVVVTQRDVVEDPEFRAALLARGTLDGFLAVVDRDGRFELHRLPLLPRPPLCSADLDLKDVLEGRAKAVPLVAEGGDLPAIVRMHPFPFLFPLAGSITSWCHDEDGRVVAVVGNRQLMRYVGTSKGAEVHPALLGPGRTMWVGTAGDRVYLIKGATTHRPARLQSLAWSERDETTVDLGPGCLPERVVGGRVFGDVILIYGATFAVALASADGQLLSTSEDGLMPIQGRFYRTRSEVVVAASWDGQRVRMDPLPLPPGWSSRDLVTVLSSRTGDAIWLVRVDGLIRNLETGTEVRVRGEGSVLPDFFKNRASRTSADGTRMIWATLAERRGPIRMFDTATGEFAEAGRGEVRTFTLDRPPSPPARTVFRVVEALGVSGGCLAIRRREGRWRVLSMDGVPKFRELDKGEVPVHVVDVLASGVATPFGCTLQRVEWPTGHVAWVDGRGLLHLRSPHPGSAEISVMMTDGEAALWTTHGGLIGPDFYFRERFAAAVADVREAMAGFVATL